MTLATHRVGQRLRPASLIITPHTEPVVPMFDLLDALLVSRVLQSPAVQAAVRKHLGPDTADACKRVGEQIQSAATVARAGRCPVTRAERIQVVSLVVSLAVMPALAAAAGNTMQLVVSTAVGLLISFAFVFVEGRDEDPFPPSRDRAESPASSSSPASSKAPPYQPLAPVAPAARAKPTPASVAIAKQRIAAREARELERASTPRARLRVEPDEQPRDPALPIPSSTFLF